jgi:hypothetical protein
MNHGGLNATLSHDRARHHIGQRCGLGRRSVAGTRFVGTGLGDTRFLGVSYRTGNSTGLALYAPAADDGWEGVWTYADGTEIGKEKWARR